MSICDPYLQAEEKLKLTRRRCLELIDKIWNIVECNSDKSTRILPGYSSLKSISMKSKSPIVQMTMTSNMTGKHSARFWRPVFLAWEERFETPCTQFKRAPGIQLSCGWHLYCFISKRKKHQWYSWLLYGSWRENP